MTASVFAGLASLADSPASTLPAPRLTSAPPLTASFAGALELASTRTEAPARSSRPKGPLSIAQLMEMLMILEMLGLPAPLWMIDAFRACGMTDMADNLVARNERLTKERGDASRVQQLDAAAGAPHAAAS